MLFRSPAAIASAVNDALAPKGASIDFLPMTPQAVWRALRTARVSETGLSKTARSET